MNYLNKFRLLLLFILFISCINEKNTFNIKGDALGTTYNIIIDSSLEKIDLSKSIDSIFSVVNNSMSTYLQNSIISDVNKNIKTKVDEHFIKVFTKSKEVWEESDRYFDPTVGILVNAYGFGPIVLSDNGNNKSIESLKHLVGFDKVFLNNNNEVIKENKDIFIDFNSIAKGYSVDLIGEFLSQKKINNYLIEVGGEILAKGINKRTKSVWTLGIQDPLNQDKYIQTVELNDKALATSGNYRKYRLDPETGERYVHTINPITGLTSKNNTLSVSVISEDCITSDAWATALLSLDINRGRSIIDEKETLEALWIISDNDKVEIIKSKNWNKLRN
ncbi:MAG: FAD:protein FMN transferase [Bacteroidota bacterium]|nr:FAD:protein FMN transferase [Bacteroidota bacterium]